MFNKNFNSYLCAFICVVSSAVEPVLSKIGYRYFITPYELLILRFLIGGIVVLPLVKRYRWIGWKNTAGLLWLALLLMSTCGLVLVALKYLTAVVVITIITATPAFVAIVNQILGKEILSRRFWLGFLLCFTGILLSIEIHRGTSNSQTFNIIGLLCAFGSVAVSTIYRTQLDDATRNFPPMQVSTYMFIMDAIVAVFFLPTMWPMSGKTWVIGSIIGIAAAIANISFLMAIYFMGSTRMSVIGLLQRPLVILCAALILKEPLSTVQIAGIILVIMGIQMAKVTKRTQILSKELAVALK
ncbi:MAG: DMT family transporter [Candidatus Eremiobacterota bacterium]